jgi:hypothetical protein
MDNNMKTNNLENLKENIIEAFIFYNSEKASETVGDMVLELVKNGSERNEIIQLLDYFRVKFWDEKKEKDYDNIIAIMDSLTGWCSPRARI